MLESRWRGQPGRLEVWYSSLTDPATGTGIWIHHEVVAPADAGPAFAHGWIAVFEPGASPLLRRFGPEPWQQPPRGFSCGTVRYDGDLTGSAGEVSWELAADATDAPLYTFPRWAWRREVLPAAQVVPRPTTRYRGTVQLADRRLTLRDAVGADARIYGRGNARRWGWLHADLGGGDVCEVVAAVSMRPGLRRLPPLALVKLRLAGEDWPPDPVVAALGLRTRLRPDGFHVHGRVGRRQLRVAVQLPRDETVEVDYRDPDGAPLLCRNSARATAVIEVSRPGAGRRSWRLDSTAHAEVGGFRSGGATP